MRFLLLTAALAGVVPTLAKSDELTDLKAQLQALQSRVQTLEAEKSKRSAAQPALTARASAALPVKATVAPISLDPPVVAPNEKPELKVGGPEKPRVELYGQAQVDAIYDTKKMDPTWSAAFRPSKIPVNCPPVGTDAGCGTDGLTTLSVRQSKFGVKGFLPTAEGEVKTQFEFDLYGMGANAGETMFHLQQAWGSWGPFLVGHTSSLFMDDDVFPNIIDYWGPSGMIFIHDPQLRWTPYEMDGLLFAVALELPGYAGDLGKVPQLFPDLFAGPLAGLQTTTKYPDVTAHLRYDGMWGHVQAAGVVRWISFDNATGINGAPSGTVFGWGVNLSGALKTFGEDALRAQVAYGYGIAAYSNDCCLDIVPASLLPFSGQALPLLDWLVYYDHWWTPKWSSSIGFSQNVQNNTAVQLDSDQHKGSYASVNLLYRPIQNVTVGAEGMWGERVDKNGAKGDDQRIQVSAQVKY
jgi:hypothetical protein